MNLSDLIRESDRLRSQIADESDPALQRAMRKTFNHYHKQIRTATRHRHPWFGLKFNLLFLVVVFVAFIYACDLLVKTFGKANTVVAVILAATALVLLTAMIFLLMKVISPDNYTQLVQLCFNSFHRLRGKIDLDDKALPPGPSSQSLPPPPVPRTTLDGPSISSLSADADSQSDDC